jgi:cell division protein FtsL
MKSTTDYIVGNTAIRIVNKGSRIQIIDVQKKEKKRKFRMKCLASLTTGLIVLASCLYVVNLQNTKVLLDRQVYSLQTEIDEMEKENKLLVRETEETAVNYEDILAKAKALGMKFPQKEQICYYRVDKSTAIRVNSSAYEKK